MTSHITTTIRGSASRPPRSAGRVPFSAVRLGNGAQRSHIIPQDSVSRYQNLFENIGQAQLPNGDRPFDPTDFLDNGQPLPSSAENANGRAMIDASQHRGSHPRVNELVERRLAVIDRDLAAALRVAQTPADRNAARLVAERRVRNVADALAAISVGGVVDPSRPELRAVYNMADPNARNIWPDWDQLSDSQRRDRIVDNLEDLFGRYVTPSGDLTPQGDRMIGALRDLTGGNVGAIGPTDARLVHANLGHMEARGIDPSRVDDNAYLQRNLDEIAPPGSDLADRAQRLDTARTARRLGRTATRTLLRLLPIFDYVDIAGTVVAVINGDAHFGPTLDSDALFEGGPEYLANLARNSPQTGALGTIQVPPSATQDANGNQLTGTAFSEAAWAHVLRSYSLPTGLRFIEVLPATPTTDGQYRVDDIRTPQAEHVQVYFRNPPSGGSNSPAAAAVELRRTGQNGNILVIHDREGGNARAVLDTSRETQDDLHTIMTSPDPELRRLARERIAARQIASRPVDVVDGSTDLTSVEQAVEAIEAQTVNGAIPEIPGTTAETPEDEVGTAVIDVVGDRRRVVRGPLGFIRRLVADLERGPGVVVNEIRGFFQSDENLISYEDIGSILGSQLANALPIDNPFLRIGASTAIGTLLTNIGQSLDLVGSLNDAGQRLGMSQAINEAFKDLDLNALQVGTGAVSSFLVGNLLGELGLAGDTLDAAVAFAGPTIGKIAFNVLSRAQGGWNAGLSTQFYASAAASFIGSKLADKIVSFDSLYGQIGASIGEAVGSIIATKLLASSLASFNPYAIAAAAVIVAVSKIVGGLIGSLFGPSTSSATVSWDEDQQEFIVGRPTSKRGGSKDAAQGLSSTVADALNAVVGATGARVLGDVADQRFGMRNKSYVYWDAPTNYGVSNRSKNFEDIMKFGIKVGLDRVVSQLGGGDVFAKRALLNSLAAQSVTTLNLESLFADFLVAQDYSTYLEDQSSLHNLIVEIPDSVFAAGWVATFARAHELGIHRRASTDWIGGWSLFLDEMNDGAVDEVGWSAGAVRLEYKAAAKERLFGFTDEDDVVNAYIADTVDNQSKDEIVGSDGGEEIRIVGDELQPGTARVRQIDGTLATVDSPFEILVAATIHAGAGDDFVHAGDLGNDVFGEGGDDKLYGGKLDDWLFGGDGVDELYAGAHGGGPGGNGNYLDGGAGNDLIYGAEGSDWLEGGDGTDLLDGGGGGDILAGGAGAADQLKGGHGDDQYIVRVGDGADEADELALGAPVVAGGATGDAVRDRFTMLSNPLNAHFRNWFGGLAEIEDAETVRATYGETAPGAVAAVQAGGEDAIVFGRGIGVGDIRLMRSQTADEAADPNCTTTTGSDLIVQVMAPDGQFSGTELRVRDWFTNPFKRVEWLKFADGNDIRIADVETFIVGTNEDDILNGTDGRDFVYGGGGNDHIRLFAGDDIGSGGTGDDAVWGDGDRDLLIGGLGKDMLYGGTHSDTLSGDAGDDELMGEDGADVLSGGRGDDLIVGGAGADTIKFSRGDGRDTIIAEVATASAAANDPNWRTIWSGGYWGSGYGEHYLDWNETFRWVTVDEVRQLQWYAIDAPQVFEASDAIEFEIGIDIQDVMFVRSGRDLVLVVSNENAESVTAATAADSITIRNWYLTDSDWSTQRPIGRFGFYQTGTLEAETGNWTLIAGGDGGDSITAVRASAAVVERFWITGGGGDDVITGNDAEDILHGNSGVDKLHGGGGEDVLYGGAGNDVLDGGSGADVLAGGEGADTAYYAGSAPVHASLADPSRNTGDAAGDRYSSVENLTGGSGDDVLAGDDGENVLEGGEGTDVLRGSFGDDTYVWKGGQGSDVIVEGAFDYQEVMRADGTLLPGYSVSFERWLNDESVPSYIYILDITGPSGSVYSNTFDSTAHYTEGRPDLWPADGWQSGYFATGNGKQRVRDALLALDAGSDTIELAEGISLSDLSFEVINDDLIIRHSQGGGLTIRGQFGAGGHQRVETLQFADGGSVSLAVVLAATAASPNVSGNSNSAVDELIAGESGSNQLSGLGGNDALSGGGGNDSLDGGDGNDVLEGGEGADVLVGGAHGAATADPTGWGDTARYAGSTAPVQVDLTAGTGTGGHAEGDTLSGIEHVVGSDSAVGDTLTGNEADNRLFGLAGDDTLSGGDGNDVLVGGDGADTMHGGWGDDNLDGGDGNDVLTGTVGKDLLSGGAGDDLLRAGISLFHTSATGTLDGGDGDDRLFGAGNADTLSGGAGTDTLYGGSGNDTLEGGAGNDTLYDGMGDDTMAGGAGDDTLLGSSGGDTYVFGAATGVDEITDSEGVNRMVFAEIDRARIWLTQSGNDLVVRVIGGSSQVTVRDYFVNPASAMREIFVGNDALFLKRAGSVAVASSLIAKMSAAPVPASLSAVPADIAALLDSQWVAGGASAPEVANQSVSLSEMAEPDQGVSVSGSVAATDVDDNIIGYSLATAPQKGWVALDGSTGTWTYTPNLYANGSDSFVIRVSDADGQTADQTVSLAIAAVNSRPLFAGDQPALAIDENSAAGTSLGTIVATDPDGNALSFLALPETSPFAISSTGLISLKQGFALDYETASSFTIAVQVMDGQLTAGRDFTVTVNNVAERPNAPQFVGAPLDVAPEGTGPGTHIAQLSATDPDGDPVSFRLRSGSSPELSMSGDHLTFGPGFSGDFESLAAGKDLVDRDGDGLKEIEYTAHVESFDGALASAESTSVTVRFEDVNEAPTSVELTGAATAPERDRPEIGAPLDAVPLGVLVAADPDLGETHSFSVTDARFEVVNGNQLRLKQGAALDYESAPSDANGRYVDVAVTAADRFGLTVQRNLRIYITDSVDFIYGTAAPETLSGTAGRDAIYGREGADSLHGQAGDDVVFGEAGGDYLYGQTGDDKLYGGSEADTVTGHEGTDELYGEAGDDRLDGGLGADRLDGGDGYDTALYVNATSAVTVSLASGTGTGGEAAGDTLVAIEGVEGSNYADSLTGSIANDRLYGRNGNDNLSGGAGDDLLYGQANDDTMLGGDGVDMLDGGTENDSIYGGNHNDTIYGSTGNDVLRGEDGEDNIRGDAGNDVIYGGDGNDGVRAAGTDPARGFSWTYLTGGDGDDTIDGGNGDDAIIGGFGADNLIGSLGFDQAGYTDSTAAVTINLETGTGLYGTAQGDTLSGIERVVGSNYNDTLTGSFRDDVFDGGSGNDTIDGAAGNDVLFGAAGNDVLTGGAGSDRLEGGAGDDVYTVDAGDTVVEASTGGTGDEVRTSLADYTLGNFVEKLTGTSALGQYLRGNTLNNVIAGGSGNDLIWLQAAGSDTASGGAGNDRFLMGATLASGDALNGGEGSDQLVIQGSYNLALGAASMTAIETLVLLAGNDTSYGDSGLSTYSYLLTAHDSNVAAGAVLTVDGSQLRVGENLTFGGQLETDGAFLMLGGRGNDVLTGGARDDVFEFGDGRWGTADRVTGGAGTDTLRLRGAYTVTFSSLQLNSIEAIELTSAAIGSAFTYSLTMTDGNVAAGATLVVSGGTLRAGESLTFDGAAELDGSYAIAGGAGADVLKGGAQRDTIQGDFGNDELRGNGGDDGIAGGDGDDSIYGDSGADTVEADAGNDTVHGGADDDRIWGGDGNDVLRGEAGADTVYGEGGDDQIEGGDGADTLDGGDGADTLKGEAGADAIYGGSGADQIWGGDDVDNVDGGDGNDVVRGDSGADILAGGTGDDTIHGGTEGDTVRGDAGLDTLHGEAGADTIDGGAGNDIVYGGDGDDAIDGGADNDTLYGDSGIDTIAGGTGDDAIHGGTENDTLRGGDGSDVLRGEAGSDRLEGGAGNDTYHVDESDLVVENAGEGVDEVFTALAQYTLTANVENLTGTSAGSQTLWDNALGNVVTGGAQRDWLYLRGGGNDRVIANGGHDLITFGTTLDAGDEVDGGDGYDVIQLQGNLSFSTAGFRLSNIERIAFLSGTEGRYGEAGTSSYAYSITIADATFANGTNFDFSAGWLVAGEQFTFNGAAETGANFTLIAGGGTDTLTGGGGNDIIWFDMGCYAAGDTAVGGGGTDELILRGNYTAAFGAGSWSGIEKLTISNGAAWAQTFAYNLKTHDSNVASGELLTVAAGGLRSDETLAFDGSLETDGTFDITGGAAADTLIGGQLADTIRGGDGNDLLRGGGGRDTLEGGGGGDTIYGDAHGDYLWGGAGADTLDAGDDGDELHGGADNDTMIGGNGNDSYFVGRNEGDDVIINYDESNGIDRLALTDEITYQDVWFERVTRAGALSATGTDLRVVILGAGGTEGTVTVENWFKPGVPPELFQLDLISDTTGRGALAIDVDALTRLMATRTRPASNEAYQTDLADDLDYSREVEAAWRHITPPKIAAITPISEIEPLDTAIRTFSFQVRAWHVDEAGFGFNIPVDDVDIIVETTDGSALGNYLTVQSISDPAPDGTRTVTARLAQEFSGVPPLRVRAVIQGVTNPSHHVSTALPMTVAPTADTPTVVESDTSGRPGTLIPLTFSIDSSDKDGSERYWLMVENLPAGYSLVNWTGQAHNGMRIVPVQNRAGTTVVAKGTSVYEVYKNDTTTWATSATGTGVSGDFMVRAKSLLGTTSAFVGMDSNPTQDNSHTSLDYSIQLHTDGRGYIYESGTHRLNFAVNGQVFIWRSGTTLKYGTGPDFATASTTGVIRSVEGVTGPLNFDSSFGAGENRVEVEVREPPISFDPSSLIGLKLSVPTGRYEDALLTLTPQSRDGGSMRNGTSQVLKVRVDAQPTGIAVRGLGTSAAVSINENTPTTASAGVAVGTAAVADPDSIEANRISTDFNLLPKAGWGEERIVSTVGPDGNLVRALETGQVTGLGTDSGYAGGGVYGAAADGPPDITRAYKYTIFVKPENNAGQYLYFAPSGQYEIASTGPESYGYFTYQYSNNLVQDRWYRIEGYVLPAGHATVSGDLFGGVFDTVTGAKVANTATFRFTPGATQTGARFFSYYGNSGYSAQWYQPQVEKLDYKYELVTNADGRFAINEFTGQISAASTPAGSNLDYESATSHNVVVRTTDSTGLYTERTVTIAVNNVNERPDALGLPTSTTAHSESFTGEAGHAGLTLATFAMSDPDRETPTLAITAGNAQGWFTTSGGILKFASHNFTSAWLRANAGTLGIDSGWNSDVDGDGLKEIRVATLTLAAKDAGGLFGDSRTFNVLIEDRNEAPVFTPANPHLQLAENSGDGAIVGTVVGTDVDGPASELRYHFLVNGAPSPTSVDNKFRIDKDTGTVTVNGVTALNYESTPTLSYWIRVADKALGTHTLSTTNILYIDLQNVNERPHPLAPPTMTAHSETFSGETAHGGKTIATFAPTDPDAGAGPALTILSGNDYGYFTVSGNSVTFAAGTNFTAAWLRANKGNFSIDTGWNSDVDGDGLKEIRVGRLTVASKDSGNLYSDPYTFDVLIEDRNEAPVFSANPFSFSIPENGGSYQYVGQVTGSDVDGPAGELRYTFLNQASYWDSNLARWVSGSSDGRFVISNADGQIWKNGNYGIDYEQTPWFAHMVAIHDKNGGGAHMLSSTAQVNIGVTNVNEQPGPISLASRNLLSESLPGESHAYSAYATFNMPDPDGVAPSLVILGGNPHGWFSASGNTLSLTFANFTSDWLRSTLGQHGQDSGYYYDIDGDGLKEIRVAQLTLASRDAGGLQSNPFAFDVLIEDKNEAPRFSDSAYSFSVYENPGNYEQVGTITASDVDGAASELRYYFVNGSYYYNSAIARHVVASPDNRFIVDQMTGQVFTHGQQPLDYEGTRSFSYQVAAYDRNAVGPHTVAGTATYTLNLLNRNDNAPVQPTVQSYGTTAFNENTGAGYTVAQLNAPADADGGLTALSYVLSSNPGGLFEIVGQTLRMRTDRTPDFEAFAPGHQSNTTVQVRFYTTDGTYNSAENYVNVQINNVNDIAPTTPVISAFGQTTFDENTGAGTVVAYLEGSSDPDGPSISYELSNNPHGLFQIVGYTVRMMTSPDFEAIATGDSTLLQVRIRATDGTFYSGENAFHVMIRNVAEMTTFTQVPSSFTVAENTGYGTVVSDGVRAHDVHGNGVSYWIDAASNPNGAFGINSYGQIVIANGVDYEQGGWLQDASGKYANLRIFAADDGAAAAETTVQVRITNQVLTVRNADGSMAPGFSIHQSSQQYYSGYMNNLVYYSSTGTVMRDGGWSSYPMYSSQPTANAAIAAGFRITGNGYEFLSDDEFNTATLAPIVFDLLGAGLDNAFGASKVDFDIDGNGAPEKLNWLNPGFAFLALDRNGDGRIGSGLEISFTQDKPGAQTDLEGLAAFDSNRDGKLSSADLRFGEFLVWQDSNSDGTSQAGEIKTLTQAGIASIGLAPTPTGRTLANSSGNVTLNTAAFTFADGRTGTLGDTVLRADLADSGDGDSSDGDDGGDDSDAPAVAFAARDFARKTGKYRLSVDGGTLSIVPAKAKGVLDARAGVIGPATMLSFRNRQIGMLAPVVLDLDGDGVELVSSKKARARFDMNGDGSLDDTGWVGRGDGFLVIDRDGDGQVSGPGELSFLAEKVGAKSDLDALSALDSNRDGKIDSTDARFGELKIWVDSNGNGVTDAGELKTLADHGIASIGLSAASNRQTAKIGDNVVLSTGTFTRTDGSTGTLADAALAFRPGRGGAAAASAGLDVAELERRLESLRSGIDRPLLGGLDFPREPSPTLPRTGEASEGDPADASGEGASAASAAAELVDRRTALIAQDMASFGAGSGEAEWRLRDRVQPANFDYFAQ